MILTATVHVLRAVLRLTSVLLVFNLPNDPEQTDSGVGITTQSSSPTGTMTVRISSHTIRAWVHRPLLLLLLNLTSSHEKSKGWFIITTFGTTVCAFCPIPLSCCNPLLILPRSSSPCSLSAPQQAQAAYPRL